MTAAPQQPAPAPAPLQVVPDPAPLWSSTIDGPSPVTAALADAGEHLGLRFTAADRTATVLFTAAEVYELRKALAVWLAGHAQATCPRHWLVQRINDPRGPWCLDCGRNAHGDPVVDPSTVRGLS